MNFAKKQNQLADDGATRRYNAKFKNKEKCKTPHVTEQQIKEAFVKTVNAILENKDQVIKDCKELILELTDTTLIAEKNKTAR